MNISRAVHELTRYENELKFLIETWLGSFKGRAELNRAKPMNEVSQLTSLELLCQP